MWWSWDGRFWGWCLSARCTSKVYRRSRSGQSHNKSSPKRPTVLQTFKAPRKGVELRILFAARMFWRFCQLDSGSRCYFNSPLQKREDTGASFLYWLDWKSKHQPRSQGLFPILSAGPVLKIGKRPWERGCLNIKTEMLMNEKLPDQV